MPPTSDRPFEIVTAGSYDERKRQQARKTFGFAGVKPGSGMQPTTELARTADKYQVDAGLALAINMALCVGAPLLVTGEPGTGKTQSAYFLSWLLGLPLFRVQIRSTSQADDLRFDFDAVAYLRYANQKDGPERDRSHFLKERALWQAFVCETPSILLIDEIDKAPRDLPNDLLRELDEREFAHPWNRDETVRAKVSGSPITIATSNAERRLPDAFLRRCIVHHIEFTPELARSVVGARGSTFPGLDPALREKAVERFFALRRVDLGRKPSTAELLAWLAILSARGVTAAELDQPLAALPALGAMVKDHADVDILRKVVAPRTRAAQ